MMKLMLGALEVREHGIVKIYVWRTEMKPMSILDPAQIEQVSGGRNIAPGNLEYRPSVFDVPELLDVHGCWYSVDSFATEHDYRTGENHLQVNWSDKDGQHRTDEHYKTEAELNAAHDALLSAMQEGTIRSAGCR
jgi:hypothetical protein